MDDDIRTRIGLSLVPGVGAYRARMLMQRVDRPKDVFDLSESDLLAIHGIGPQVAKSMHNFVGWKYVDEVILRTEKLGCKLIIPEDAIYPELLRQIDDPPLVLWAKGDVNVLQLAGIAVVGTRSPSPYGRDMAAMFTRELATAGFCVVSGLAYGIDTVAHRSALDAGGATIAVLGSGIDHIYPVPNTTLADRIEAGKGLVISEFPPGTKPDYCNFPVRNRVVSGLSLGVLVVETKDKGGSMITARLALEQNREVFVIPHNLNNSRATGCHKLIRESSGKLVENIEDIISEFPGVVTQSLRQTPVADLLPALAPEGLSKDEALVWKQVSTNSGSITIDQVGAKLQMNLPNLLTHLLNLETSGHLRRRPGNRLEIIQTM
jgi:DNA processing protein